MQDIRYAEKNAPCLPPRKFEQQMVVLAVGQPETGKTTALRNIFASFAQDPEFSLTDVAGLTETDFEEEPRRWVTEVQCTDSADKHALTFKVVVRRRRPRLCAACAASACATVCWALRAASLRARLPAVPLHVPP